MTADRRRASSPSAARRGSAGTAPVAAARCGQRALARARLGDLRRRVRRRGGVRVVGLAAPPGDVLLVLAAGSRLSAYIGATVGEIGFLRGIWLDGSRRLAWLEDYAASLAEDADAPVPGAPRRRHPLRGRLVRATPAPSASSLEDVSLAPRARVGGGARRRERRRQDDAREAPLPPVPAERRAHPRSTASTLARMPADGWRARLAGAFQDFFRFEFRARHTRRRRRPAAPRRRRRGRRRRRARGRGRRRDAARRRDSRRSSAPPGRRASSLSFGQWQKLALARGFMRERRSCSCSTSRPPRSTPRPSTRSSSATPRAARGEQITLLVSHRFSTVRMADFIVVLDGARVVEAGTHEELMARRRPVRGALRDPGGGLPLREGEPCRTDRV